MNSYSSTHLGCKHSSSFLSLFRVEPGEHGLELVLGAMTNELDIINTTRSDQSRVQSLNIVGGHEHYPPLGGGHAIYCIEQTTEGESVKTLVRRLGH